MVATKNTQSLTEFRQNATETLKRLNKTGDAEILTVNGQAKAILLSPATYDELSRDAQLTRDAAVMRVAIGQIERGEGRDADEFFEELRTELASLKRSKRPATSRPRRRGKSR
jgi:PHD/YefM family antitoxin component YafN of YafNO toxin-antitoxin module